MENYVDIFVCGCSILFKQYVIRSFVYGVAVVFSITSVLAQEVHQSNDAPLQLTMETSWASQNKYIELFRGQRYQNYRELDTIGLTNNGTLNSETGKQDHAGIALRWQSTEGWLLHFEAQRQSGVTNYDGYLQVANGNLMPYSAYTGNVSTQMSASIGYALNANNFSYLSKDWQITPLALLRRSQWQRNLVQYRETYDFNTFAAGALLQWRIRHGSLIELQAVTGRVSSANVNVPDFNFSGVQPGSNFSEWYIAISQDLGIMFGVDYLNGWRGSARYLISKYGHDQSQIVNNKQAPSNQNQSSIWALGLQKQF